MFVSFYPGVQEAALFHSTLVYRKLVVSFYPGVQEAGLDEKSRGLSVKEMLQENKELVERMRIMTRPDARIF